MLIDFRELFPRYNIKPKGVLHVGANVGEEAPIYLELGIKKQLWVEANPEIFEKLKQNISNNPDAAAINHCISDKYERVIFHVSNNGSQSSSILELGNHKIVHPDVFYTKEIEMDAIPLAAFFIDEDIDFLNLDLQGAELKALKGMRDLLDQFKWIYTEVNSKETYLGCAQIQEMDLFLNSKGFRRVETFNNGGFLDRLGWSDALYIK